MKAAYGGDMDIVSFLCGVAVTLLAESVALICVTERLQLRIRRIQKQEE